MSVSVSVRGWFSDPYPEGDAELSEGFEQGLELLDEIPEAAMETQASIDAWLATKDLERGPVQTPIPEDLPVFGLEESAVNTTHNALYDPSKGSLTLQTGAGACIGAIFVAIASNLFLISKLKAVKAAVKKVGGAKAAFKALKRAYKAARSKGHSRAASAKKAFKRVFNREGVSQEVRNTLIEIASVGGVINNCF